MGLKNKNFYNEMSAHKLGWDPSWFNAEKFDGKLLRNIQKFQKAHNLDVDGLCGEDTFRRIYTLREAQFDALKDKWGTTEQKQNKYIICTGEKIKIEWDKVVLMGDEGNLKLDKGYEVVSSKREVNQFVVHWDAALSSKSCHDILKRRGLSVQFMIDNDGTIYQSVDANHICYQAKGFNATSIGVEISNAVETKYQSYYVRKGFGKRPVLPKQKIHKGTYGPLLGFYPVQLEALKALIKAVCTNYDIPIRVPLDGNKKLANTVHLPETQMRKWRGVCAHYHLTTRKMDVIGTDLQELVKSMI